MEEISINLFEKNAKLCNKNHLLRDYVSISKHKDEYLKSIMPGIVDKVVLECSIEKKYYDGFIDILKHHDFTILGDQNDYHYKAICLDYESNPLLYKNYKESVESIKNSLLDIENKRKEYKELEHNNVLFYFLPYNNTIITLNDFINECKDEIIKYAKKNDITIMLRIKGEGNPIEGFIGFNFLDADITDKEVVIDYICNITINVDFKNRVSVYLASMALTSISLNCEDIKGLNVHIIADNIKYYE